MSTALEFRTLAMAITALATLGCASSGLLSSRSDWGGDFTDRSPPTAKCPGGTLEQLKTRMDVSATVIPLIEEVKLPKAVKAELLAGAQLLKFWFGTNPQEPGYWGFGGHLVSRDGCIIYARTTEHDN